MADLYKLLPLSMACGLGEKILFHFQVSLDFWAVQMRHVSQDVDEAAKLEQVQKAAQKPPLKLIKPVDTRWNSIYDAHTRMVCHGVPKLVRNKFFPGGSEGICQCCGCVAL